MRLDGDALFCVEADEGQAMTPQLLLADAVVSGASGGGSLTCCLDEELPHQQECIVGRLAGRCSKECIECSVFMGIIWL